MPIHDPGRRPYSVQLFNGGVGGWYSRLRVRWANFCVEGRSRAFGANTYSNNSPTPTLPSIAKSSTCQLEPNELLGVPLDMKHNGPLRLGHPAHSVTAGGELGRYELARDCHPIFHLYKTWRIRILGNGTELTSFASDIFLFSCTRLGLDHFNLSSAHPFSSTFFLRHNR
ncbi:hypothetical protein G7K_3169-t1 [Saitoella complicata NRRL Y-17804]|uniref:Uncharacterized protein n=1 Tax=Saitoella complicata (strain BCRC 22490 / CBS 7301 / JCM 7358 / NBRC 10748 / NRRL Y-17804) TaxID=698492 RepID=A0A0E9NGS2_SAICN|nr:hypothetical protein G7K_3169-t1 [Saitoella complicata NRRL Y-17804]